MITYLIIGITVLISFLAFPEYSANGKDFSIIQRVIHRKQYYRLFSTHLCMWGGHYLIVNMFVLYFFRQMLKIISATFLETELNFFVILYIGEFSSPIPESDKIPE